MTTKNYMMPPMAWLRVARYMHGWLERELGGEAKVKGRRVISVQHLRGAREVLRMETSDEAGTVAGSAMSAMWRNALEAGMEIDAEAVARVYGMTRQELESYMPIECPRMALTKDGVMRPWGLNVSFGRSQAAALQGLLREAFWGAVAEYDADYAALLDGSHYTDAEMLEEFCRETHTPDYQVDMIRREWQRRNKYGPAAAEPSQ